MSWCTPWVRIRQEGTSIWKGSFAQVSYNYSLILNLLLFMLKPLLNIQTQVKIFVFQDFLNWNQFTMHYWVIEINWEIMRLEKYDTKHITTDLVERKHMHVIECLCCWSIVWNKYVKYYCNTHNKLRKGHDRYNVYCSLKFGKYLEYVYLTFYNIFLFPEKIQRHCTFVTVLYYQLPGDWMDWRI